MQLGSRLQKPMCGAMLDRTDAFSVNLSAVFALNEGNGGPRELLSGAVTTLSGATSWGMGPTPTQGNYLASASNTGYGTVTVPATNSWNTVSVAALWSGTVAQSYGFVANKGSNNDWAFQSDTTGTKLLFSISSHSATSSQSYMIDGLWHTIHGTYDGTNILLYVDGVLTASATSAGHTGTTNPINFFRYGGGGFFSTGKLAGLWQWNNRVLTAAEVVLHKGSPWRMFAYPWVQSSWLKRPTPYHQLFRGVNAGLDGP